MKRDEWLPDWNPAGAGKFHRKLQKVELSFGQIPLLVSLWDWDRKKTCRNGDFALKGLKKRMRCIKNIDSRFTKGR